MRTSPVLQFSCCVASAVLGILPARAESKTTVAAIVPLTGNAADQGEWARRGLEIANEQLGEAGRFDIMYEDSKGGDPATAVQGYKSLVVREKPIAVFTYGSGAGMALSPLVNTDHVVQMGIATSTPKYRSENDFTFRNFPSASLESEFLADSLFGQLGVKELAVININNDYGVGTVGAVKNAFMAKGGKVAFEETFNPGDTDFKPILLKLRQSKVKDVYLAVYPTDGALLLKQAKELKVDCRFIASVAIIGGKDFFSIAGNAAEGLVVASTSIDAESEFSRRYNAKYQHESPAQQIYAARAYDALMIVSKALSGCAVRNSECLRDNLFGIRDYHGASGTISFDSAGDIDTSFTLYSVHGQRFVPVG